jgi:aryl-alcohol dehydrogenase-like predicted oxidoreductase
MRTDLTRREFLKATTAGVVAGAAALGAAEAAPPGAKIPRRTLGRTGVSVSILGLGGGSNFLRAATTDDEAVALLNMVIDGGVNYLDTASSYGRGESERRYGLVLAKRRKEVFLTSKTGDRTRDGALRSVEESLKRLQTDHLDLIQMHSIVPRDDPERMAAKDGVFAGLMELKAQKVVRFVGITGHTTVGVMRACVDRFEGLDTALFPINPARDGREVSPYNADPPNPEGAFETVLLPHCVKKGLGVIAMKVTGAGKLIGQGAGRADAPVLIRYAMSAPGVTLAIVGPGTMENARRNLELAASFTPMREEERKALAAHLTGATARLAYLRPGYVDSAVLQKKRSGVGRHRTARWKGFNERAVIVISGLFYRPAPVMAILPEAEIAVNRTVEVSLLLPVEIRPRDARPTG